MDSLEGRGLCCYAVFASDMGRMWTRNIWRYLGGYGRLLALYELAVGF